MTPRCVLMLVAVVVASVALSGCRGVDIFGKDKKIKQLEGDLTSARRELAKARKDTDRASSELAEKQNRIDSLMKLGPKRLDKLFYVQGIKLGNYTGGADFDDKAGDDGIKVFLRPIDSNGDTIKAAGSVTVQLYDLAQPADKTLIGEYKWSVDEVAKAFSSGFISYQFTFKCPWKSGTPGHKEITVRVEFTDYLTGKQFNAQKLCKVDLPGV